MGNSTARLLLIGLDNAGKSSILARIMNPQESARGITPTIGYKKDTFARCGFDFEVLDMSGESKYRELWQQNATVAEEKEKVHGIIFVIDSSDKMRIRVAKSQLDILLENQMLPKQIPFLFYANKSDIKGSASYEQVSEMMELKNLRNEHMLVQCSGLTGRRVEDGINWLCNVVKLRIEAGR